MSVVAKPTAVEPTAPTSSGAASRIPKAILALGLAGVTALAIIGICLPQIELLVKPSPEAFPEFMVEISIFFYNRRTVFPNRPIQDYKTKRYEGLFGCVEAYDMHMAALAFSVIACIFIGFAFFISVAATITPKVPVKFAVLLNFLAFIAFTIAWPLSWSQTTAKHCGRYLQDASNSEGNKAYTANRGSGLNVLVGAWATAFLLLNYGVVLANKATVAKVAALLALKQ